MLEEYPKYYGKRIVDMVAVIRFDDPSNPTEAELEQLAYENSDKITNAKLYGYLTSTELKNFDNACDCRSVCEVMKNPYLYDIQHEVGCKYKQENN